MAQDSTFAGSIPALYEQCLVPVIFAPFADDLVERALALDPHAVLEIAAGTGVVSHKLAAALPRARIVATDLNPAMLEVAGANGSAANLAFEPADAQSLPFPAQAFDLVCAQFGAMFFPDKPGAYREARRVLARGGAWLFNVWDSLEANPGSAAVHHAVESALPDPKPGFLARIPFGYHDSAQIEQDLRAAGFGEVQVERVAKTSAPGTAAALARGMCQGSPLMAEIAVHPLQLREAALAAATAAAEAAEPAAGFPMSALVVIAR
jgi:ubiquinone/menaquinone biosynthesis C-methylase UbiE